MIFFLCIVLFVIAVLLIFIKIDDASLETFLIVFSLFASGVVFFLSTLCFPVHTITEDYTIKDIASTTDSYVFTDTNGKTHILENDDVKFYFENTDTSTATKKREITRNLIVAPFDVFQKEYFEIKLANPSQTR